MSDMGTWREEVLVAVEAAREGDAYAQLSARGLVQFFNSRVPAAYRINTGSQDG